MNMPSCIVFRRLYILCDKEPLSHPPSLPFPARLYKRYCAMSRVSSGFSLLEENQLLLHWGHRGLVQIESFLKIHRRFDKYFGPLLHVRLQPPDQPPISATRRCKNTNLYAFCRSVLPLIDWRNRDTLTAHTLWWTAVVTKKCNLSLHSKSLNVESSRPTQSIFT